MQQEFSVPLPQSFPTNCCCLVGNMREGQFVPAPSGYRQREVSLCVGDNAHAILFNSDADVLHTIASLIDNVTCDLSLRLSRQCDDGEEDGDDGFLVHVHFDLSVLPYSRKGENMSVWDVKSSYTGT